VSVVVHRLFFYNRPLHHRFRRFVTAKKSRLFVEIGWLIVELLSPTCSSFVVKKKSDVVQVLLLLQQSLQPLQKQQTNVSTTLQVCLGRIDNLLLLLRAATKPGPSTRTTTNNNALYSATVTLHCGD
jgi:hypothetical protein